LTVLSFYFAVVLPEASRSSEGLTLEQAADFLIRHGYALLFGWVLLEQMGLPIPAAPLLIAAGALARAGKMNLTFAVALAFIAVILADPQAKCPLCLRHRRHRLRPRRPCLSP